MVEVDIDVDFPEIEIRRVVVSGGDPTDIAAAILSAAQAAPIHANVKQTNDEDIIGDGTEGDKFRSHLVG